MSVHDNTVNVSAEVTICNPNANAVLYTYLRFCIYVKIIFYSITKSATSVFALSFYLIDVVEMNILQALSTILSSDLPRHSNTGCFKETASIDGCLTICSNPLTKEN